MLQASGQGILIIGDESKDCIEQNSRLRSGEVFQTLIIERCCKLHRKLFRGSSARENAPRHDPQRTQVREGAGPIEGRLSHSERETAATNHQHRHRRPGTRRNHRHSTCTVKVQGRKGQERKELLEYLTKLEFEQYMSAETKRSRHKGRACTSAKTMKQRRGMDDGRHECDRSLTSELCPSMARVVSTTSSR
jgi:hypothetical protein